VDWPTTAKAVCWRVIGGHQQDTLIPTDLGIADTVFKLGEMIKRALEAGVVSDSEADSWSCELKQADERGEFYAALTMFCISGVKRSV